MKYDEFKEHIENIWHERFPNSMIIIEKSTGFSSTWINIHPLLASGKADLPYQILDNDMIKYRFAISGNGADIGSDDTDLPGSLLLDNPVKGYIVRSVDNDYFCGYHKVYFRKVTGDPEKVISAFKAFTERLYNSIRADMVDGMIHENYIALVQKNVR